MKTLHDSIVEAKTRLPLPALLDRLDLAPHARKSARCPLHEDRSPSFSIFSGGSGWGWKCHAGCGGGDEIDFLETYLRTTKTEAVRRFLDMAGGQPAPLAASRAAKASVASSGPKLPDDATPGTERDWRALAHLRGLWWTATAKAAELGTLFFGTVCSFPSWILTDERRLCAEARRLDGKPFPAFGDLSERKAHTLKGSVKNWPVGIAVRGFSPSDFRAILVVEGGPDYLAALHFTLRDKSDCLPLAILGAGAASALHPEALELLKGCRVRFYPHADANGVGTKAVQNWARQLRRARSAVDAFTFEGLQKADGSHVKDLNDGAFLSEKDAAELEGLLP